MSIKEMALKACPPMPDPISEKDDDWDYNEQYRDCYIEGANAVLEKAAIWLKDFCTEHYIMRYSDCSEVDENEIVEIFKEKMEE